METDTEIGLLPIHRHFTVKSPLLIRAQVHID